MTANPEPSGIPGHRTLAELEAGVADVRRSPVDGGTVGMLVARTEPGQRSVLEAGELTVERGLDGDDWSIRGSTSTPDGRAHPEAQLTLINQRYLELVAGDRRRWALAGDQIVVDLDLGVANLTAGDRLQVGGAMIEITAKPHTGCVKFTARYGRDALEHVNTDVGRELRLRGIYARVVQPGRIRVGDRLTRR